MSEQQPPAPWGEAGSRRRRAIPIILVALALVAAMWFVFRHGSGSTGPAEPGPPAGTFKPTKSQWEGLKLSEVRIQRFFDSVATDGSIAFNDDTMTQVFSPFSGRVTRLIAKPGDIVVKGAPLMAVESSEISQGLSDVASTKATLETARASEKRQHQLYEAGAAAEKDWKQAQTDLVAAEANWNAARNRLHILGKTDAEIDSLEGEPLHRAESLVLAPIGGTVIQRQVGLGQYVASATSGATTPVYTIGDVSKVWLVANVRESEAPFVRPGQSVEVNVLALPGSSLSARITWVAAAVDPTTHRLPVRAEIANTGGLLRPGMFVNFTVATSAPSDGPGIPQSAVVYDGEEAQAFVAAADGTVTLRRIRCGRTHDGLIEILDGLRPGEKVVSSGTLFVDRAAQGN